VFTDNAILDQLRPYRGYRSITMLQPRYNANYHSLQFYAQHRFTGASQISAAYTWSKNLTDSQNDRSNAPQNTFDIRSEYSRATLDRRHVFSMNYIYELPFFKGQPGFTGKVLGGWQASGIVTYNTGLPFTITTSSFDAAGLGNNPAAIAGNRPNLLCDPNANAPHTFQQWFNTACFQTNPAVGTPVANVPGTAGRGVVQGPSTARVDFTMTKNIRFGETTRLQLRGDRYQCHPGNLWYSDGGARPPHYSARREVYLLASGRNVWLSQADAPDVCMCVAGMSSQEPTSAKKPSAAVLQWFLIAGHLEVINRRKTYS
jgi:hypothetical protein